jgi:hypothetical protein
MQTDAERRSEIERLDLEIERIMQRMIERMLTTKVRLDPEACARLREKVRGDGSFLDRWLTAAGL